jgi:hypothetical protein
LFSDGWATEVRSFAQKTARTRLTDKVMPIKEYSKIVHSEWETEAKKFLPEIPNHAQYLIIYTCGYGKAIKAISKHFP